MDRKIARNSAVSIGKRKDHVSRRRSHDPVYIWGPFYLSGGRPSDDGESGDGDVCVKALHFGEGEGIKLATLGECGGEGFCDKGGDCGRGVVLLQTSLTKIRGFLEKLKEGF
ncbi:hypothetical protein Tco_0170111 [Tanacetum coccineum]